MQDKILVVNLCSALFETEGVTSYPNEKRVYTIPLFLGERGYLQETNGEDDPSSRFHGSHKLSFECTNPQPRLDRQGVDCSNASPDNHNDLCHGNRSRLWAHPRGSVSYRSIGRNKSCKARSSGRWSGASTLSRPDPRSRHDRGACQRCECIVGYTWWMLAWVSEWGWKLERERERERGEELTSRRLFISMVLLFLSPF